MGRLLGGSTWSVVPCCLLLSILAAAAGGAEETPLITNLLTRIAEHEQESFPLEQQARILETRGLVPFWDSMNAADPERRLEVLAEVGLRSLRLGKPTSTASYGLGIEEVRYGEGGDLVDTAGWRTILD